MGGGNNGGDSSAVETKLIDVKTIFAVGSAFAALKNDGTVVSWGGVVDGGDSSLVQPLLINIQTIAGYQYGAAFAAIVVGP